MHEDVTSQERSKERLYEEEIELKWEKGGSGLVFYTDAQYWQEEEGGIQRTTLIIVFPINVKKPVYQDICVYMTEYILRLRSD